MSKSTLNHFVIYQLGEILNKAVAFFLIPLYTREFSTEEYGILVLLLAINLIIGNLLGLGITSGLARSYYDHENPETRKTIFSTAFIANLASTLLFCSFFFYSTDLINEIIFEGSLNNDFITWVIIIAVLDTIKTPGFVVLKISIKSFLYTSWSLASFIIRILAIILFVVKFNLGIKGVLYGYAMSSLLSNLIYYNVRNYFNSSFNFSELIKMLKYGLPLIPDAILFFVLTISDRFFINHFLSPSQVGIYALGGQFSSFVVIALIQPLKNIWSAKLFSMEKSQYAQTYYKKVLEVYFIVGIILSTCISVLIIDFLRIFTSEPYWPSAKIVPFLFIAYIFMGGNSFVGVGIALKRKTIYNPLIKLVSVVIYIYISLTLISVWGIYGAATASIISFLAMFIMTYAVSKKYLNIKYNWGRLILILFISIFIIFISEYFAITNLLGSILMRMVIVITYVSFLWLGSFINIEEKNIIKNIINKIQMKNI